MSKDEKGGGTQKDGSKSTLYCSRCYDLGEFINPTMTVSQMQDLVRGKLKEMHFPGFLASFFVMDIPKLKRWKA